MKHIHLLLLGILSFNIFANTNFEDYYADGQKFRLPKEEGDNFLIGYAQYLKKLNSCEKYDFKYYNPLIRKNGSYSIEGYDKNNNCMLTINYNNLREIKCLLQENDIKKIIEERIVLIKNKDGFGQLSKIEVEIYYESNKCLTKNIEKKVNQEQIDNFNKQLKEENPEIYEFINNKE